ncbi:MAG TPA: bifunctional methylenetetrahydrofolate dehydrogenase/methenyltetrahydrofolate cyclohydrolase FolD [Candidatus Fimenecus excrementigallinarum]|uniref:Bifunctional protein FolD n=1 Tax=Candidatus Fimenecus excrementigallinarum TaxID=2840816 RepID=A0A9D1ID46_9FIRM|nr:bifunctional methylenetetrahydrofolate dehydrogenase/methenyltetrahydrofolate cyclohydrolase FolD [Candidatus Fimenecus excrementigallinarum]
MATILDGKAVSAHVKAEVKREVEALAKQGVSVSLAVILVGDDPASHTYVRNKEKACAEAGIRSKTYRLPADTTEQALLALVETLNADKAVNGILCQLPLPKGLNEAAVIAAVSPEKDVDAFHAVNVGRIMLGNYAFLPCTPAGIVELLDYYRIDPAGKRCVVIGRSNIVGKPMAMLLLHRDATVTVCHSKTEDLAAITKTADILVAAVGKPRFVTADMVKPGAVVIDVGMDRDENGKLCGDVDFAAVEPKAACITPVPGGVGPMTIATLLKNTVTAAKLQNGLR